jgi:hypothetical protein
MSHLDGLPEVTARELLPGQLGGGGLLLDAGLTLHLGGMAPPHNVHCVPSPVLGLLLP